MVQIERQGFGDNGYDGSILFERKIFTERIEGVCIRRMVCQQLDGVAVLRRIQRRGRDSYVPPSVPSAFVIEAASTTASLTVSSTVVDRSSS